MNKIKSIGLALGALCMLSMSLASCHQKKADKSAAQVDTVIFEEMEVIEYDEDEIWADENVWAEEDIWADEEATK